MAAVLITCPECSRTYHIPPERLGHKAKCKCGHIWVPQASQEAHAAATPAPAGEAARQPPEQEPQQAVKAKPVRPEAVKPAQPQPAEPVAEADAGAPAAPPSEAARPTREELQAQKLVGRELGNFRIVGLLGLGGFGAVYRAFDKSLHRQVAIKVLPVAVARAGKEKIQRFLLEARAAAKLSHPNIVTVHQICQVEGIYFIVMELVDGHSLAQMVRAKRLSPQEATRIITEASRGLAHAHKRGLIHRDIKPGNIMITSDGQVKMTDFGLARDIFRDSDDTDSGRAVGTPLYMSPEQCDGEEGDSRSDVYSMAATYYVGLTRRPPYEGRNTEAVMNHHRFDPPPDPREIIPTLPAAVFRIIEKAMAKEPDDRYQTAGEFLSALEGLDFESLDPNASVTLDKVSAQIGGVTPDIGVHVGAVMKEAVRHADRSANRSRLHDSVDHLGPVKWWVLVGVLVALIVIVAVVSAFMLAGRSEAEPDEAEHVKTSTRPAGHGGQESAPQKPGDPAAARPDPGATQPVPVPTDPQPKPENGPATTPVTPAEPEEDELTKVARQKWERAVEYEKEAWTTHPSRVIEVYEEIAQYYANTEYAKKAEAAVLRLREGDTLPRPEPPPPQMLPDTPEEPEKTAPDDAQPPTDGN